MLEFKEEALRLVKGGERQASTAIESTCNAEDHPMLLIRINPYFVMAGLDPAIAHQQSGRGAMRGA
jgi:hypothetical protein